jgi:iron(III) transport system substrate-binding protein
MHRHNHRRRALAAISCAAVGVAIAGCGGGGSSDGAGTLVVYSGRSEELIGPLITTFEAESGIDVEVLYGDSSAVALQLIEEGNASPADVFFAQAPGPLGLVQSKGMLAALSSETQSIVDPKYRDPGGEWIGVSARSRTLVYDASKLTDADLPASVFELAEPGSELTVGIAPTNASFQDFVSTLRIEQGDDATLLFLDGLATNGVRTYPNNVAIVEAVGRGEIDVGLVNHYYNLELTAQDSSLTTKNHPFVAGDPGSLLLISGVAQLKTSERSEQADAFIRFLLSESSQKFFASETYEYPLLAGVAGPAGEPALTDLVPAPFAIAELGKQLSTTLALIEQAGLVS